MTSKGNNESNLEVNSGQLKELNKIMSSFSGKSQDLDKAINAALLKSNFIESLKQQVYVTNGQEKNEHQADNHEQSD